MMLTLILKLFRKGPDALICATSLITVNLPIHKRSSVCCIRFEIKGDIVVTAPFYCDYGFNISVGNNFYTNHNCTILDAAKVEIGDSVFLAPNCVISTAGHATDPLQRSQGLEFAKPIRIGNHVWIGANVSVLPGVTIGDNTIIGAGSVVNRDIPSGVVAAGNPCRVIRNITEEDKHKYPVFSSQD